MTVISIVFDVLLALMAGLMLLGGKYGLTRQLAAAPLVVAVLDICFGGNIQPMLTPVLSVLVLSLQLTVLVFCGRVWQLDRARTKSKARRRQLRRSRVAFEEGLARRESRREPVACRSGACA